MALDVLIATAGVVWAENERLHGTTITRRPRPWRHSCLVAGGGRRYAQSAEPRERTGELQGERCVRH